MRINLHIDAIVVEGTNLTRRQRDQLAGAIEAELTSQLRQRISPPGAAPGRGLGADIARQVIATLPLPGAKR
jgi:hypothetical protein